MNAAKSTHTPSAVEHEVIAKLDGARLDAAVKDLWGVSWSRARSWIETGKVFLLGQPCLDGGRVVRQGETLQLRIDARRPRLPNEIDRDAVLHQDDHIIVVRKPAGVFTVPFDEPNRDALDEQLRRLLSSQVGPRRGARAALFVVHRLDRGTSGVLVFARSAMARERLAQQFRDHSVHRRYLAIAHGR
ncbi:MAG: pseudouridine synthase, partial [Myxococcota bacterium]|nr:pseudouridine synthase [Myxococcota bacterium]